MKLLLLSVLFASATVLVAQDQITLISGEVLSGKVLEVGVDIRYRAAKLPDGPVHVLPQSEVSSIRYRNGHTDYFPGEVTPGSSFDETFALQQQYLRYRGWNRYFQGARIVDRSEFLQLLDEDPGNRELFDQGRKTRNVGIGLAGAGVIVMLLPRRVPDLPNNNPNTFSIEIERPPLTSLLVGMGISLAGSVVATIGGSRMNVALDRHNILVGQHFSLNPSWTTNGLGLTLDF